MRLFIVFYRANTYILWFFALIYFAIWLAVRRLKIAGRCREPTLNNFWHWSGLMASFDWPSMSAAKLGTWRRRSVEVDVAALQ